MAIIGAIPHFQTHTNQWIDSQQTMAPWNYALEPFTDSPEMALLLNVPLLFNAANLKMGSHIVSNDPMNSQARISWI